MRPLVLDAHSLYLRFGFYLSPLTLFPERVDLLLLLLLFFFLGGANREREQICEIEEDRDSDCVTVEQKRTTKSIHDRPLVVDFWMS